MRVQKGNVMLGGTTAYAAQQVGTIPPLIFVPFTLLCCLHTNSADLIYSDNSRQKTITTTTKIEKKLDNLL